MEVFLFIVFMSFVFFVFLVIDRLQNFAEKKIPRYKAWIDKQVNI